MKVLEIKNNLVKIAYEAQDNLALSSFVIIEDYNNPFVAQVMNIKGDLNSNFAIVKLLFTFDEEGILKNYNGTAPSVNAKVSTLPSSELLEIIPVENPIFLGNLAQQNVPLKVDKSIFENNLLICSDNMYNTANLLNNMLAQIDEKTVIIDTEGHIDSSSKIKPGKDFKLPLNYEAIDFIYENDLEDVDAVNKAVIQDVFIEVQNYIKTLPEKFLPFESFVNVIDAQYRETQIPELILLKNKLLKYKETDIFAQNLKDIMNLQIIIEKSNSLIIDISDIPDYVKKEVLRYLYEVLNETNEKIYSFVKVNNSNITKRLLKKFIEKGNVYTTIICPHEFKYIEDVKEISQNIIFFAPLTLTHDFASYNTYLNKLNTDEFVVYGAHTQNIPFITEITAPEDMAKLPSEETDEDITSDNNAEKENQDEEEEEKNNNEDDFLSFDDIMFNDNNQTENDQSADEFDKTDNTDNTEDDSQFVELEIVDDSEITDNGLDETDETSYSEEYNEEETFEETEILTENNAEDEIITEEPVTEEEYIEPEQELNEYQEDIIEEEPVAEVADEEEPVFEPLTVTEETHDHMVEQVSQDVDKMFYEKIENNEPDDFADTSEDLTEDDLNLIEDMTTEDIPLAGELDDNALPPVETEEQPPVVPIYPADDIEAADTPDFQPGEHVTTAKYGEGVVEKMIKYGNKMLCSIDFPNIGRRLLDPAMTEIKKI
ncbi:hypothetical protein J6P92_02475 [bacterium]|nr:hypothetical protein [bacterium]